MCKRESHFRVEDCTGIGDDGVEEVETISHCSEFGVKERRTRRLNSSNRDGTSER